ncbi:MAG: hypothetical protein HY646_13775 [Acidobacteria bacterium]|nr:hypothetical protein [Acidobacteriota bacterium]
MKTECQRLLDRVVTRNGFMVLPEVQPEGRKIRWMRNGRMKGWSRTHLVVDSTLAVTACGRAIDHPTHYAHVMANDFVVDCAACRRAS